MYAGNSRIRRDRRSASPIFDQSAALTGAGQNLNALVAAAPDLGHINGYDWPAPEYEMQAGCLTRHNQVLFTESWSNEGN